ncbi:MAG TPA: TPM domain-containing protein [Flavisolibacter sp.]|nr:TPM domain-containing protein [Flavisolibacter sp.]
MKLFPWQKEKEYFSAEEKARIHEAIRLAEQRTSGEVRLFIESKCKYVNALDRAKELFFQLQMDKTVDRNASLIYIAMKDRQAAVFGDEGIHQRVGQKYWEEEINKMLLNFKEQHIVDGICQCIADIGDALHQHFPYDRVTDKNELPDDIVFGK